MSASVRTEFGDVLAPEPLEPVEPRSSETTFSIVICAFQAAATIGRALRSALAQTYPPHEVIVVDDGSTDDLRQAIQPFRDRIRLIEQENRGAAAARNAGAEAATGEFMAILDADDAYHPRRLESLTALAGARPDLDLITTDARLMVDGEAVGSFTTENAFATEDQRTAIFASCFVGGWPAVRISKLRSVGGFDESFRIAFDWDCWLRMILDGSRAGLVDEPRYDYVLHFGSLASNRVASLYERVRLLEKAAEHPRLGALERDVLAASLREFRSRAVRADAEAFALGSGSRRRLAGAAIAPGIGLRTRTVAIGTMLAPPVARRVIRQEEPPAQRFGD